MLTVAAAAASSSFTSSPMPFDDDTATTHTHIYEGVPWQEQADLSSVEQNINMKLYNDMPPIIFSPNGRIHQLESAKTVSKMVSPMSNIVLAMKYGGGRNGRNNKGRGGILIISTIPTSPYLNDIHEEDDETTDADCEGNDENNKKRDEKTEDVNRKDSTDTATCETDKHEEAVALPSSLFLFEETWRDATTTGHPIFGIHPDCEGIMAATAGNTVDNTLLRQRIISVGEQAALQDEVSVLEAITSPDHNNHEPKKAQPHVNVYALAREFANLLQIPTQDMGQAAQQGFPKLIASTALILGNQQIYRIDPSAQFYECTATVIGEQADDAEYELYGQLLQHANNNNNQDMDPDTDAERDDESKNAATEIDSNTAAIEHREDTRNDTTTVASDIHKVRHYLESLSYEEAFEFGKTFIQSRVRKKYPVDTKKGTATVATTTTNTTKNHNTDNSAGAASSSPDGTTTTEPSNLESETTTTHHTPIEQPRPRRRRRRVYWQAVILDQGDDDDEDSLASPTTEAPPPTPRTYRTNPTQFRKIQRHGAFIV